MKRVLIDFYVIYNEKYAFEVEDLSKTFESQRVKYGKIGIFNFNFKVQEIRVDESDINKKCQLHYVEFEKNGPTCAGVRGKGQKGP